MLRYIQHDSHASTQSALDRFVGLTNQDSVFHMDSSSLSLSYYTQERNDKMTKKQQKEYYAKHRVVNGFNTGTRTMKALKHPSRAVQKAKMRKGIY